ncbi:transmembrane protein, putative [Medicago truncatula]|uniref:Transmembrane protein, putative n=1 Tax=Medicago truncatula TaxID=3880 RepID=A0A072UC63_MEDTR|nr:transmembrane protein, putative [Medicago truncatula]
MEVNSDFCDGQWLFLVTVVVMELIFVVVFVVVFGDGVFWMKVLRRANGGVWGFFPTVFQRLLVVV